MDGIYSRVDGRFEHNRFRFRKRQPPPPYFEDRVCSAKKIKNYIYIYIYIWGEGLGSIVGDQGALARVVFLVLSECIWNVSAVSLVLSAFDDTGSLGNPPRRVVYHCGFHPE